MNKQERERLKRVHVEVDKIRKRLDELDMDLAWLLDELDMFISDKVKERS